nr:anthrone oxygenase family protein [Glycomyces amatae]
MLSLLAALVSVGMMAGLFTGFSYAVMPGLKILDDKAWIAAMQQINKVIINGWFMPAFLGAVVFTGAAAALVGASANRAALPWVLAALALALVMFIGTVAVNVPLNDRLAAAGDPGSLADPAALRASVEAKWIAWNTVRGVASVGALLALGWALLVHGRAAG